MPIATEDLKIRQKIEDMMAYAYQALNQYPKHEKHSLVAETIDFTEINCSIQSWLGHARHADTYRLRRKLFEGFVLVRKTQ